MNRLGIIVDIAHVSDDAFWSVLRNTKAPVNASHSSCRFYTPGFERNMSDSMIAALGRNGGVIMINFGSEFLDTKFQQWEERRPMLPLRRTTPWPPALRRPHLPSGSHNGR